MILYLDTSDLAKCYLDEPGTAQILELWAAASYRATSAVAYAELMAAFARRAQERTITRAQLRTLREAVQRDWRGLAIVAVGPHLHELIDTVVRAHHLRGFDALHLASALYLARPLGTEVVFATADRALARAARAEGLGAKL